MKKPISGNQAASLHHKSSSPLCKETQSELTAGSCKATPLDACISGGSPSKSPISNSASQESTAPQAHNPHHGNGPAVPRHGSVQMVFDQMLGQSSRATLAGMPRYRPSPRKRPSPFGARIQRQTTHLPPPRFGAKCQTHETLMKEFEKGLRVRLPRKSSVQLRPARPQRLHATRGFRFICLLRFPFLR